MLEGFVRQLILGYLGRYVKDIQKEQLKITLWNEEVLLENVELILEAFDYLRLPFALKQGRVGKLSIKIPWKKLGWDPIVIILEDVFVCASKRDDQEWSAEGVEKREFAAKKAKLAAAELAKLSKRVCDNRAGRLFTSYISAKILDNIQVSIRSFHVMHHDMRGDSVHTMFGLKFSSLTIMKQNPFSSLGARIRGGQVNKTLEIMGLELYCGTYQGPLDILTMDNVRSKGTKCDSILAPCDVFMSLSVNRSGELDNNSPQHSVNARITDLEIYLDEVQLQQMLILKDYLCTSQLREKYGRYRPWCNPLTKKLDGWQKLWWHYAQDSVLLDVRKKLKKTSWRYFGQRLSYRHKYVSLYKAKLSSLHQDQSIDENVLSELEQMEKELDIEDILSYRSAAECRLQEFLLNTSAVNTNANGVGVSLDKSRNDEHLTGKSRGWLNWLSLGMLGAGGTDDSSQFSGVVSDEVIKDIYEATEFHPLNTSNVDAAASDEIYFCIIKFSIRRISAVLRSMKYNQEIAQLVLIGSTIECKLWENSATIITAINSGEMFYPCNNKVIMLIKTHPNENDLPESKHPSLKLQVDVSPNHEVEFLVKGLLEPVEVNYDAEFVVNLMEFFGVFNSFESQHQRILLSLDGIEDANRRLQSKAGYILSSYKKVIWDVCINSIVIIVPWENGVTEQWNLVLEVGAVVFTSKGVSENLYSEDKKQSYALEKLNLASNSNFSMCFQLQDLNDHLELKIRDLEMMIRMPAHSKPISVFEKFSCSIMFTFCIIPDESISKKLEVFIGVSSLHAYFSPSIYQAVLGFISHLCTAQPHSLPVNAETVESLAVTSNRLMVPEFGFCVNAKFDSVRLLVDLANDGENSLALIFVFQDLDIRYALISFEECSICLKGLNVTTSPLRGKSDGHVLYSSGNHFPTHSADKQDIGGGHGNTIDKLTNRSLSTKGCFTLNYEYDTQSMELACCKFTLWLNDAEIHCYPSVTRLIIEFFENLSAHYTSWEVKSSVSSSVYGGDPQKVTGFGFQRFGFSNYFEVGSPEHANITLDHFPFVTISNRCSLGNLEGSLLHSSPDWRKYYNLRDQRIGTQQSSTKRESKNVHVHATTPKSTAGVEGEIAPSLFDLSICGIRLHFHDSSSIIGTVTLPSSSSSLFVHGDCLEALCSLEGLIVTSSWWTKNPCEFLWGPSLSNLSPIINFRIRKKEHSSSSSHFEVGVSLQHVYCLLPPEYLAIIIGYFSLPDWSSDSNESCKGQGNEIADAEDEGSIVYKFEILDSVLILPAESFELQFLKADIQQLYCSFIDSCSSDNALEGIPPEYWVPAHKLAKRSNCLNIFGRDLLLSFLSFKDGASGCLRLEKDAMTANITLLSHLSADIWVRLPCENDLSSKNTLLTTCIMARLAECQVLVEDDRIFLGVEALLNVINQFSLVPDLSQCFKSDVLQFLQTKRCFKENSSASSMALGSVLTEVRCHINSLLIKFSHSRKGSNELFAKAEMQFTLSAVLENDHLLSLDLCFSSLELLSLPNSVALARCTSPSSTLSILDVSLLEGKKGKIELCLSFPSLDIWIHLSEWGDIVETFASYAGKLSKMSPLDTSLKSFSLERVDTSGNTVVTVPPSSLSDLACSSSDNMKQEPIDLTVKFDNICVTFHVPVCVSNKAFGELLVAADQRKLSLIVSSDQMEGSEFKYVSVTMQSKGSELLVDGKTTKLKSKMEKWSGNITVSEDKNVFSWPLFEIFHVFVEAEINHEMMKQAHVKLELRLDHLKVWLSHHFFYFWHGVTFIIPEAGSSQFPFGGINFEVKMRKVSFLLSDGRWSCSGPLFEILVRNIVLHVNSIETYLESLVMGEIQVNYNNIHKVFWEPFIEPWQFEINVTRKQEMSLNSSIMTNVHLKSIAQLNVNFTEPLIECVFRTIEMIKDSLGIIEPSDAPENHKILNSPWKHMYDGRYAPYVLQNMTSLSIAYHVYKGAVDEPDATVLKVGNSVEPGASVPLHMNDTPEEQLFDAWPAQSSDRLNEPKLSGVAHHYISIQFDGTLVPSTPISMDRVGLTCLEVDLSKAYKDDGGDNSIDSRSNFVVPVVFDVSVQRYSKLIRLYSTVILSNATSLPLELRFDIPFGVAPMILDPIYPGQELPLPLHLAEAGRIRWRPIGNSYLWSEVYNLANLLLHETRVGSLKSFVCYPTHPSSDPFRCCISVRNMRLPVYGRHKNSSHIKNTSNTPIKGGENLGMLDESNQRCVHHLTLHTPLVVKNYLPKEVSLAIESGGVTHTAFLSEAETFCNNVDPLHDLELEIHLHGFKPANLKFPRAEAFCTVAKFSGTKFTQTEIITFDPYFSNGPIKITVDKMMDALSGVRELSIFVPFLLYNCTGFPLQISESGKEVNRVNCIIPSSYDVSEQEVCQTRDGLSMVSSIHGSHATGPHWIGSSSSSHVISIRDNLSPHKQRLPSTVLISENYKERLNEQSSKIQFETQNASLYSKNRLSSSCAELNSSNSNFTGYEHGKVGACMYCPVSFSSDNELMVRVSRPQSEYFPKNIPNLLWSSPFLLVPPSGSTTVLVPQSAPNSAYMISVTSSAVAGPLTGRSSAIIFQPRYVISNACGKDLCYKQKGSDQVFRLRMGEHSHLHWMDVTRELLVSIRYNEPGWQWSGSFLPDNLGDTQVKMQNYVSGSSSIIQVEVQNADISVSDEKVVGSLRGNSGTILILLSDDDTGYMPYRIDNFSKERLRIFQQRCETFETIIHPYTSCPYAWDEPCYPHRLTVEVPGERLLGSYSLDDVKEYMPIYLQSSSEKPERKLVLSVHAEGATKVLCVIDSNYHMLDDMENSSAPHLREKNKHEQKQDKVFRYKEKVSIVIPHLGISLINVHPQELLFACAKNITVDLLQSLDQQKLFFQVSSLQIDNQLRSSPYPVMLSFVHEYKSHPAERILQRSSDGPVVHIAVSKWRKKDISLVSFEYISLRVADFCLELEQEVILSLFDFLRNVTSRFHSRVVQLSDPLSHPLWLDTVLVESSSHAQTSEYHQKARAAKKYFMHVPVNDPYKHSQSLPSVVPIGAPWQQIYLLARRHGKIYVEAFEISPITITLSFSSAPWILRNGVLTSGESLIHRGLMALADVEGAQVHLKQLTIAHHIASWESIQEIVVRHLSRQLLHEMYKVFGSAGVIGNPMGFARTLGLGLRDFLSVPARSIFESPTGLITGMAQGTTSLLSNTVYAISDAATQFSKAAHKGIVAFTFDDQAVSRMEQHQIGGASRSKGVINEVFEGLTGLLQLPIKGAEKHGLPGVLSGVALGVTGLVAKPAASILQVTGRTAQSIRNRSKLYQMRQQSFRVRFPRPLSREVPLRPYSWEEAVGKSVLAEAGDGLRFKDEVFVACKALKQAGDFVIVTERLILIASCSSLADLGKPEFHGVPADLEWVVQAEIGLQSVMHADTDQGVVHIVGSSSDTLLRQNQQAKRSDGTTVRWNSPTIPLVQTNLELALSEDAENLLQILLSTIVRGRDRGWGCRHLLHRSSIK